MQKAYLAKKVFTGEEWLYNVIITTENGFVKTITPNDYTHSPQLIDLKEDFLIPAFIDLQIYGANKKLFSVYPTIDALQDLCDYCEKGGAILFQPTVATNNLDVFHRCIDAVRNYWKEGRKGVIGLHLEGPWLNPEKRGAHLKQLIHSPSLKEAEELLEYGKDVISMITIAPEVCSPEVMELVQSYGVTISAGHSNASYGQATIAFNHGVTAVTHLYNAMSGLQHRAPGLVGASFNHHSVMASIIPDGYHVDYAAVNIAVKQMRERLFVITDAVTETDDGIYHHQLENDRYTSNGVLSGSSLTMHKAFVNLVTEVKLPVEEAAKMCSLYPAKLMGLKTNGKIAPGYAAQFLLLDDQLNLKEVITG